MATKLRTVKSAAAKARTDRAAAFKKYQAEPGNTIKKKTWLDAVTAERAAQLAVETEAELTALKDGEKLVQRVTELEAEFIAAKDALKKSNDAGDAARLARIALEENQAGAIHVGRFENPATFHEALESGELIVDYADGLKMLKDFSHGVKRSMGDEANPSLLEILQPATFSIYYDDQGTILDRRIWKCYGPTGTALVDFEPEYLFREKQHILGLEHKVAVAAV